MGRGRLHRRPSRRPGEILSWFIAARSVGGGIRGASGAPGSLVTEARRGAGLRFFRETFEAHPADTHGILQELEGLNPVIRDRRVAAIRKFYYANSALEKTGSARDTGKARVETLPVPELIRQLQQLVLGSPLYGAYINPDHGRDDIPGRLPLLAFDTQPTTEKLILPWTTED